ncbi:MAG: inositol monophosphatase [Gammaproteobacteria bacterium]|jgi:myo-inositol-1(or 4)-monophosphatase|nr:inositol monophosphatase [Gammaproteobacteria bacterium]
MHPYLNTAVKAARRAGDIIVRGLARFEGMETATKGLNDFVTNIDLAAESAIIETLRDAYPHHAFLAEESGASGTGDITWIIDPLDGTTNFMHGFPTFAVSIACQMAGRMEHAVIYDPMRQEIFSASRGSGAYLENKRLRVSRQRTLDGALIGTGFPYRENLQLLDPYMAMMKAVMQRAAGLRRPGSAALDLAYVAAGRTDGFWEIGLKPWDTAAGTLLIREAGGLVGTLDGGEYRQNGNIVAGNPRVFNELLEALAPFLTDELRENGTA